jgi:hypothetical protein
LIRSNEKRYCRFVMARKSRIQFPGAIYHLMNRGDDRKRIFLDYTDRETFLVGWSANRLMMGTHGHLGDLLQCRQPAKPRQLANQPLNL